MKGAVSAQKALHFHLAHGRLGTTEPNLDCVVAKNLILGCKASTVKLLFSWWSDLGVEERGVVAMTEFLASR